MTPMPQADQPSDHPDSIVRLVHGKPPTRAVDARPWPDIDVRASRRPDARRPHLSPRDAASSLADMDRGHRPVGERPGRLRGAGRAGSRRRCLRRRGLGARLFRVERPAVALARRRRRALERQVTRARPGPPAAECARQGKCRRGRSRACRASAQAPSARHRGSRQRRDAARPRVRQPARHRPVARRARRLLCAAGRQRRRPIRSIRSRSASWVRSNPTGWRRPCNAARRAWPRAFSMPGRRCRRFARWPSASPRATTRRWPSCARSAPSRARWANRSALPWTRARSRPSTLFLGPPSCGAVRGRRSFGRLARQGAGAGAAPGRRAASARVVRQPGVRSIDRAGRHRPRRRSSGRSRCGPATLRLHAKVFFDRVAPCDLDARARRVVRWLKASGRSEVSREDIRRTALGQTVNASEADRVLARLTTAGVLRPLAPEARPQGGRPALRWEVNPALQTT